MKRVVVTGIGAVTSLGNSFGESWNAAMVGASGISPIEKFDASSLKWRFAGELKKFEAGLYLSGKEIRHLDPFVHYAVSASLMAVEDAGLVQKSEVKGFSASELQRFRTSALDSAAVVIGSSRGGITSIERSLSGSNCSNGSSRSRLSPYLMPSTSVNAASSYVSQRLGAKGYSLGISNACVSGTNAIGEGHRLIKAGYKGPVIAGGAEAPMCSFCIEGYGIAGALSKINDKSASRPFDIKRDGFVLSEGACILVLEEYAVAIKRGARIYGEIAGYGNTSDAFHQTRPSPEGEARAIQFALEEACLSSKEIDYISAHATSTPLGDRAEAEAIRIAFGRRAAEIPLSSTKSMTGHMLSASGAFEAGITLMSIYKSTITPTINLRDIDPDCRLNHVTKTMKIGIRAAVSNSFGFGGANAVLVFKKI